MRVQKINGVSHQPRIIGNQSRKVNNPSFGNFKLSVAKRTLQIGDEVVGLGGRVFTIEDGRIAEHSLRNVKTVYGGDGEVAIAELSTVAGGKGRTLYSGSKAQVFTRRGLQDLGAAIAKLFDVKLV